MERVLGVRKGAWTTEEDILLRRCIEKYGEGKWHQVPLRAGLNRCRKSCRLRWLNYLRPNIKRGEFTVDEVDLIVRLHKLLGNRWSLIAGRLPGRTANDVKNYWNTHLSKKSVFVREEDMKSKAQTSNVIIKPRPRTFSKNLSWLRAAKPTTTVIDTNLISQPGDFNINKTAEQDQYIWWESLLVVEEGRSTGFDGGEDMAAVPAVTDGGETSEEKGEIGNWDDVSFDVDFWDLLTADHHSHQL